MSWRPLASVLVALGLPVAAWAHHPKHHVEVSLEGKDDRVVVPRRVKPMASRRGGAGPKAAPSGPVVAYLNFDGGTISNNGDDQDDAADNVSSLLAGQGGAQVTVPRFGGTKKQRAEIVACVQELYKPFNIVITDERPESGGYQMIMVGGTSALLGYDDQTGGVAPYDGEIVQGAVGYVFSKTVGLKDTRILCEVTAHELGHTLGLDHEYLCQDPMTYLYGCGDKTFQDVDARCGEDGERDCGDGKATQNSYRVLGANLGFAPGVDASANAQGNDQTQNDQTQNDQTQNDQSDQGDDQQTTDQQGDGQDGADGQDGDVDPNAVAPEDEGPLVDVTSEQQPVQYGGHAVSVHVHAEDEDGISMIELGWADGRKTVIYDCANMPATAPATCQQDGDNDWTFQVLARRGSRTFAVRVTDGNGYATVSEEQTIKIHR